VLSTERRLIYLKKKKKEINLGMKTSYLLKKKKEKENKKERLI
jgi:hypothetical protein